MTARAIVRFVRDCRDRGKTVIYSTHVMSEVEKAVDHRANDLGSVTVPVVGTGERVADRGHCPLRIEAQREGEACRRQMYSNNK